MNRLSNFAAFLFLIIIKGAVLNETFFFLFLYFSAALEIGF
jgi:hypothetical protein